MSDTETGGVEYHEIKVNGTAQGVKRWGRPDDPAPFTVQAVETEGPYLCKCGKQFEKREDAMEHLRDTAPTEVEHSGGSE